MKKILVVDDDKRLRELLCEYLEKEGFDVFAVADAKAARDAIKNPPDIMIVDVMMPNETGISLTKSIKEKIDIPILMLTAMGEFEDRIAGLENGADDYLTKPFEPRELLIRIQNLLKRSVTSRIIRFGKFSLNTDTGELFKENAYINITSNELSLLLILAENNNKSVSRENLSNRFKGISERSVDVQIARLRQKIEKDPKNPEYLQTSRGYGYILRAKYEIQ